MLHIIHTLRRIYIRNRKYIVTTFVGSTDANEKRARARESTRLAKNVAGRRKTGDSGKVALGKREVRRTKRNRTRTRTRWGSGRHISSSRTGKILSTCVAFFLFVAYSAQNDSYVGGIPDRHNDNDDYDDATSTYSSRFVRSFAKRTPPLMLPPPTMPQTFGPYVHDFLCEREHTVFKCAVFFLNKMPPLIFFHHFSLWPIATPLATRT